MTRRFESVLLLLRLRQMRSLNKASHVGNGASHCAISKTRENVSFANVASFDRVAFECRRHVDLLRRTLKVWNL